MIRRIAVVVVLAAISSACSNVKTESNFQHSQKQYEALVWQQSEQLQRQRESILALQQQREQMQKQLLQLTQAINNDAPALTPSAERPSVSTDKPGKREKRVQVDASGKLILGQVEWAWFDLFGDSVKARIDTGAKTSTLYASGVQVFERDGAGWVRFSVTSPWEGENQPQERTFEAPLVRKVKVRQNESEPPSRRPVVRLTTKVGSIVEDIDFVLQSKSSGTFPVMLGRSFIRDIAIVDVAQQYSQKRHTKAPKL